MNHKSAGTDSYALVTGGSEGIGRAVSEALAREGFHLLLVALPDKKLESSAEEIRIGCGCNVFTFGVDMRQEGADLAIYKWITSLGVQVSVLVNNAGFGHLGSFTRYDRNFYNGLMQINILNVVGLTRLLMDDLSKAPRAYILNVGSIASFFPIPYKTVYASSKYFIYSFSRALREEMRNTGISVSLLCPGPVKTNQDVMARIACAGMMGRLMALDADKVGRMAVRRMLKGKWLLLPGLPARFAYYSARVIPTSFKERLLARSFRRGEDKF